MSEEAALLKQVPFERFESGRTGSNRARAAGMSRVVAYHRLACYLFDLGLRGHYHYSGHQSDVSIRATLIRRRLSSSRTLHIPQYSRRTRVTIVWSTAVAADAFSMRWSMR